MSSPVVIRLQADKLDEEAAKFAQAPLRAPLFLNSIPKSGTHLLRNILRMFVAPDQTWPREFIQLPNLAANRGAFDAQTPRMSWGHLLFSDDAAVFLRDVRHVLLVRDPYDWVLARARFFVSDEFNGPLNTIKNGNASAEAILNLMIFGAIDKSPDLKDIYTLNGAAWMGQGVHLVRYEELAGHVKALETPAAEAYFRGLFAACGFDPVPEDWRDRVRIGADRKHSGTARENLTVGVEFPDELPDAQKRLVDYAAPGLRALLGYV